VPQKPHILSQLDEIYRLVRDLIIFGKKIFLTIFDQRGDPYHENWPNFFFFKYDQITHQEHFSNHLALFKGE
jgi:hypothetical protein